MWMIFKDIFQTNTYLDHFGSFLGIFGPFFLAFLDKFAERSNFFAGSIESRDSLLECMVDPSKRLLGPILKISPLRM